MIKGRDLVIIAHHLAVPVKEKDPWPFVLSHVETTRDGDTARHPYGEVKGVSRARGKIITGIEDELSQKRLVEKGIINHKIEFSILSGWRKGSPSIFLLP